jgi:hypothetical protein
LGLDIGDGTEISDNDYYDKYYACEKNDKISEIIELSRQKAGSNTSDISANDIVSKLKEYAQYFVLKDENGEISDTVRNNLARLEHLRRNTFHLANDRTKLPKSKVTAESIKDENIRQHARITTFKGPDELRRLKYEKFDGNKSEWNFDKIWYDYNFMDELSVRLKRANEKTSKK